MLRLLCSREPFPLLSFPQYFGKLEEEQGGSREFGLGQRGLTSKQTAMLADDGEGTLAKGQLSDLAVGLWGPSQGWQSGWVGRGSE